MSRQCEPTYAVEVKVNYLISAIQKTIDHEKAAHARRLKAYDKALVEWRRKTASKLHQYGDRVLDGGDFPRGSYGNPTLPSKPSKPELNLRQAEKDLALLRASIVPTLKIKSADYLSRYL